MDETTIGKPRRPSRLSRAALGRLKQPLPPELVSERTTEHGEVLRYIEGWRAIEQANAVFGHDRWGAELVGEVMCRELPTRGAGDASAALYTATVRVAARGCVPHSDIGTAVAEDDSAEAHAVAVKAAVTDALKRALRHFGARFGNELSAATDGPALVPSVADADELRRRVLAIAASAGADEARTHGWVERRYGRSLAELDSEALLSCVDALSRGLHRRDGSRAA